jgi:hypothetical protein
MKLIVVRMTLVDRERGYSGVSHHDNQLKKNHIGRPRLLPSRGGSNHADSAGPPLQVSDLRFLYISMLLRAFASSCESNDIYFTRSREDAKRSGIHTMNWIPYPPGFGSPGSLNLVRYRGLSGPP